MRQGMLTDVNHSITLAQPLKSIRPYPTDHITCATQVSQMAHMYVSPARITMNEDHSKNSTASGKIWIIQYWRAPNRPRSEFWGSLSQKSLRHLAHKSQGQAFSWCQTKKA